MWKSALLVAALAAVATPGAAQATLVRSPDLSAGWVGEPGRVYFHFLHRFEAGPAPARKVTNTPTFLVGAPVGRSVLVGFHYATNSAVARGRPNEWEFFGRWAAVRGDRWDLAAQGGYNLGAASVDGELTVATRLGRLRAFAVGRAFSAWRDTNQSRFAAGLGGSFRLLDWLALAGDVVAPVDLAADESPAWSAGFQLRLPYTPHTLSLHASNAATTTLEGSTVGAGTVRYGFEFTIPVTLRRYLPIGRGGGGEAAARPVPAPSMDATAPDTGMADMGAMATDTVVVHIKNLAYGTERLEVEAGTTVVWVNDDPVAHSAVSDAELWDSELIQPGERWARTFDRPGEFAYHCTPHPFMKAVVVVTEGRME